MYIIISHSWKGTIVYVEVRYESSESGKVGHSLRERVLQCAAMELAAMGRRAWRTQTGTLVCG